MLCSESLCRCRATPHIDGMKRTREAFAGVRSTHGSGTEQHSDLTCCAYGHECAILRDDASAALLDSDQHLQSWSGDDSARVDRYDVRLLLHSVRQLGTASNSTASASEAEEAEDLDFERYRDLYPQASATPEPEQDSAPRSVPEPSIGAAPAVPVTPDIPFVPQFAVPDSIKGHLPVTERMHKIILQTAKYVRQSGGQTEFVLRVKQAYNPNFEFLEPKSLQHAYFRWLVATKPEEMITIDAAPVSQEHETTNAGTQQDVSHLQGQSAVDKAHETAQALSTHGPELLPGHRDTTGQAAEQSQADQQAVSPRSDVAGEPQPASAPSQAAAANQAPVQRPALPLADMAALAQRIGTSATASASQAYTSHALHQSSSAQLPLAAAHHPHADVNGKASSVSADNTVPPELQAIIQKLVAFIKKAGPRFEATVRAKEKANPKFAFLLPWNQYHWFYKEQLVSQLGQATADEVFALRATSSGPVTPSSAPVQSPLADPAAEQAPIATPSTDQLEPLTTAQPGPDTVQQDSVEAQASSPGDIQQAVTSQQAPSAGTASVTTKGTSDVRSNNAGASIGGLQQASTAQRKTAGQAAVASVPSNPRFAPKPVAQSVAEATVSGEGPEGPSSIVEGTTASDAVATPKPDEPHAAHAAPGSLEAVMEAQNALLTERQQQPQLAVSQEELQTQRRKLVRQMLEAKQKAAAETEEQKRQKQQSALAKYRQAFASDTEEEVIHMVQEDDPEHEPLEPGEWVDEPEEKPGPAPVLTVAARGALPSLEDLIKPRQDLVPHQRMFPLPRPASPSHDRHASAEVAPASPSTSGRSQGSDSERDTRRRHHRKRRRSRPRDNSCSSSQERSSSDRKAKRQKSKHKRSKSSKRRFKEAFKEAFKKAAKSRKSRDHGRSRRSRSRSSSSSESAGRGHKRKARKAVSDNDRSDGTVQAGINDADALRAKVRAMLGSLK